MSDTKYSRELAATICEQMAEGRSLRTVCRQPGMPSEGTVRGWAVRDIDGFAERYRAARLLLIEAYGDEIIDIADEAERDPRDRQVRVHARQWVMSKIAPRRWGERLLMAGDAENPIRVQHDLSLTALSSDQLEALERFAAALLAQER